MGGWIGGQAEYVMIPYADFNALKFPDKAQAMEKILDLTCLSDILAHRFSRLCVGGRDDRRDGADLRRRARRVGRRRIRVAPGRRRRHGRGFQQGASRAGALVRMRDD